MLKWTDVENFESPVENSDLHHSVSKWLDALGAEFGCMESWRQAIEVLGFDPLVVLQNPFLCDCGVAWQFYSCVSEDLAKKKRIVLDTAGHHLDGRWLAIIDNFPAPTSITPLKDNIRGRFSKVIRRIVGAQQRKRLSRLRLDILDIRGEVALFVPKEDGHFGIIQPIADAVKEGGIFKVIFGVFSEQHFRRAQSLGFPTVPLWGGGCRTELKAATEVVDRVIRHARSNIDASLSVFFQRYLLRLLSSLWREWGGGLSEIPERFERELGRVSPAFVFVGNGNTKEGRALVSISKKKGIPTASIQHGTIVGGGSEWRHFDVDRFFVWGESSRESLLAALVLETRIVVAGSPKVEEGVRRFKETNSDGGRRFRILVASSGKGHQVDIKSYKQFLGWFQDLAEECIDFEWVVRLHPKERAEDFSWTTNLLHMSIEGPDPKADGFGIYRSLGTCDAMVTILSAAALDAMSVGIPIVAFRPEAMVSYLASIPFLNCGATYNVENVVEAAAVMQGLASGKVNLEISDAARRHVRREFGGNRAPTQRIYNDLIKLARRD
jgi:hypothetical protein